MLAAYDSLVQAAHRLKTSVTDPEADLPVADLESEKTVRIGALFAFDAPTTCGLHLRGGGATSFAPTSWVKSG
jgi:hypothetical protein